MQTKKCKKCGKTKIYSDFKPDKTCKDDYRNVCKVCSNKRHKELRLLRRKDPLYLEKCRKQDREYCKKRYQEDDKYRKLVNRRSKEYNYKMYNENSEFKKRTNERNKLNMRKRRKDPEFRKLKQKEKTEYCKRRYQEDVEYRFIQSVRTRIRSGITNGGGEKNTSSQELLGCSWDEAREHIEKQFTEGMTWDNHALHGWHIDHIRPCASFDLTDPEQQKKCFHYTNLQPLWAIDNLSKGDYWDGDNF